MTCEEAEQAIRLRLGGELDEATAARLAAHLEACGVCRSVLEVAQAAMGRGEELRAVLEEVQDRLGRALSLAQQAGDYRLARAVCLAGQVLTQATEEESQP